MPWIGYHNSEINWKTGKVKMTRCPEECGKQYKPKQGKLKWQKQKVKKGKEKKEKKSRRRRKNRKNRK